jgi:RimJ/RimL family protein N-acetyltransferase
MFNSHDQLSIREIKEQDFSSIVNYFLDADKEFLLGMGVDSSKLPKRKEWLNLLLAEHTKPVERKKFFYVIWLLNSEPVGHSNINKISFGEEAYMHLHLWHADRRKNGMGFELTKKSIPYYFDHFQLKRLYCEPSAFNPAPNNTLRSSALNL